MAGVFQDLVTYTLIAILVGLGIFALYKTGFKLNAPLSPGGAVGIVNAVALGVFLFVGFEWVTPLVEEVTQTKQIYRGMMIALGILSVVYAVFTTAMTAAVPKDVLMVAPAPTGAGPYGAGRPGGLSNDCGDPFYLDENI
ncbi:MAG: amino acid permease [Candidatus Syntrophopropionicum ammoniitolerans]